MCMCALMIASVAMAVDQIGVFTDALGTSCNLGNIAGQFSSSATVMHRYTPGATGSRFKINFPPGTAFFGMPTQYVSIGVVQSDISFAYGGCVSGSIIIGQINAIYQSGVGQVVPADSFSDILFTDCSFAEKTATGLKFSVGPPGPDCVEPIATEASTWGSVKALYR